MPAACLPVGGVDGQNAKSTLLRGCLDYFDIWFFRFAFSCAILSSVSVIFLYGKKLNAKNYRGWHCRCA